MKVVLFCGGLGTRLREHTSTIPKSMVPIGDKPIIWHLMKYYSYYGHNDFILCLGYKGECVKHYFVPETSLSHAAEHSIANWNNTGWNITFVDTGLEANIGQRLVAVNHLIKQEEVFLANYSDGLSDLPLDRYLDYFNQYGKTACFASVRPTNSFHAVDVNADGVVNDICPASQAGFWINGGFFVFKDTVFDYIKDGEELVEAPFKRLIRDEQLIAYPYEGFWACMDTLKDKINFDNLEKGDDRLWRVWQDK